MAIEFSRNITFGQYLDLNSVVHRLDPRVKLVGTAGLMLALLITRSFAGLGLAFICVALIHAVARIPLGYALRGMRLIFGTLLIILSFQILFFPNPSDPWWQWGVLSLSPGGLLQALQTMIRVILIYHLTSMLMFTTALMDLADGTESLFNPAKWLGIPVNELTLTFIIALKFVPLLVSELERLIKAQAARGERFDQGGLIKRARKVGSLLVPLFVNAFARAEVLTTAMNARCYRGGQGRTKRRVLRMDGTDLFALFLLIVAPVAILLVSWLT
jgi:energy-coupling factor transport system permease protein